MRQEHEFGQRPLIAGSFTGIRSWRPSTDGELQPVVVPADVWNQGLNEAQCHSPNLAFHQMTLALKSMVMSGSEVSWSMGMLSAQFNGRVYLVKRPKPKPRPQPISQAVHAAGTLDCTCGFYAYFDLRDNPYHKPGHVLGLVEGFGTMTIGARGFRASKARIIALVEPVSPEVRKRYDVPVFSTVAAALAEFPLSVPPEVPRAEVLDHRAALLAARRNRNTGPASRVGLDGRKRR